MVSWLRDRIPMTTKFPSIISIRSLSRLLTKEKVVKSLSIVSSSSNKLAFALLKPITTLPTTVTRLRSLSMGTSASLVSKQ